MIRTLTLALVLAAAPAIVAAPAPRAVATHTHKCQSCGHVWHHTDASRGNAADHTCPKCNTLLPHPWHKYTGPTPAAAAMPAAPLTYAELHARVLAGEAGVLYVGVPAGSPGGLVARVDSLAGFAAGVYRCRRDATGDAVMSLLAPAPPPPGPVRRVLGLVSPYCPTGRCPLTR